MRQGFAQRLDVLWKSAERRELICKRGGQPTRQATIQETVWYSTKEEEQVGFKLYRKVKGASQTPPTIYASGCIQHAAPSRFPLHDTFTQCTCNGS